MDVREIHRLFAPHTPPTGDLAHNPGMCPNWESNQQPFGSQAGAQSPEPHWPEQNMKILNVQLFVPKVKIQGKMIFINLAHMGKNV